MTLAEARPLTRIHLAEMGSLYLRNKVWWLEYWHEGTQHRESSKSQDEKVARKLLKQRHAELNRDEFISPKNDRLLVKEFLEAVKLDYQLAGNRSQATLRWRLAPLLKSFGHLRASQLTTSMVDSYKAQRLEAGKAGATVNRELATLRRAYRLAGKRKLIAPGKVPTIDLLPENNAREGFLEPADFEVVVSHLPAYLQDFARFAYQSGWRKGEVQTLEWGDVDRTHRRITLRREHSKNKEPRILPLTPALAAIAERRWHERQVTGADAVTMLCPFVFHREGRTVGDFRKAWGQACMKAGFAKPRLDAHGCPVLNRTGQPVLVATILFHDMRRSAVRNLDRKGVPQAVAMKITGHKTASVYRRYRIVDENDMREALERVEAAIEERKVVAIGEGRE